MWAWFLAYAEGMRDVIGLTGLDCWEKYQAWEDAGREGGFRYMHQEFCIVSDFPQKLTIDNQNRPHNEHGASHRWRDGFEIYHLHGVRFEKELYLQIISREMPMEEVLKIADIDQRVQAMKFAKTGLREFYTSQKGKCIDKFSKLDIEARPVHYELWEIPQGEIFSKTVHFAIYDCPTSNARGQKREYAKGVPACKTVAEALSWGMSSDVNVISPEQWKLLIPLRDES